MIGACAVRWAGRAWTDLRQSRRGSGKLWRSRRGSTQLWQSRRGSTQLWQSRRGSTALEFALVALPLVMLIFGVIEFGRLLFTDQALEQAAAETARCMGVKSTLCTANGSYSQTATASFLQSWLTDANVSVSAPTFNANDSCSGVSGFSTVSLTYTFQTALPAIIAALAPGLTLTAYACFPNQS